MKYHIYDTQNKELAGMDIDDKGFYGIEFKDNQFKLFLNSKIAEGVKVFDEQHKGDVSAAMTKTVSKDDKNIGYAILEFLRYSGYAVNRDTAELKNEIETILASFPEGDPRKEIQNMLPKLDYLETTLLLRELKKLN